MQLGTDYTISNGSAKFINLALDSIYCEMTHPAYPDFQGANVFKTTYVHPIAYPRYELANFTTINRTDSVALSLASPVMVLLFILSGMAMVMLPSIRLEQPINSSVLSQKRTRRCVFLWQKLMIS